jgi:hypothetical protein
MSNSYGQDPEVVLNDAGSPEVLERHAQRILAEAYFDRHFPIAGGTNQDIIVSI